MKMKSKDASRFWDKVDKTESCWEWTSALRCGYGIFRLSGKIVSAHRLSFRMANPDTLIDGLVIRHICDNKVCVNPSHLEVGTHQDNTDDMYARSRFHANITNSDIVDIRMEEYDSTVVDRVMKKYELSYQQTRNILTGATYSYVEPVGRKIPKQKYRRKLSDEEVDEIRQMVKNPYWGQQKELAEKYGVSRNFIQRIQYGTY